MSEEKLYVIKSRSDDKFYLSGDRVTPNWSDNLVRLFRNYEVAKEIAEDNNGQPVTLVEEPEKVVLTKEQAGIVERAHNSYDPAGCISLGPYEEMLMNAYVNGYTVENEKKYNVKVPHTSLYYWKKLDGALSINDLVANDKYDAIKFTEAEIEHYGLQDCEKVECDNDD